jgi:N-acetylmuramoyl-L-alanine amidase
MKAISSLLFTLLFAVSIGYSSGESNFIDHYKVTAKRGDGVITMLKRYELYGHGCNISAFYEINKLKQNPVIYVGKEYVLPIRIYKYNKTSIRSTIGNNDMAVAKAIAKYNRELRDKGLKKTYYMEDNILYVPFHLLDCPEPNTVPNPVKVKPTGTTAEITKTETKKTYLENNLYGDYKKFEKISDELKGEAYYIISGHGGPDPGAMCSHSKVDLCEDEYAYDVSLRLARNLEANGAKVFMIIQDENDGIRDYPLLKKDYDEVCIGGDKIPRKQLSRLKQRVDAVNDHYAANRTKYKSHKVIAIHVDSRPTHKRQDVFFYHCPGSDKGKQIANNIQNTFRKKYKIHRKNGEYHGTVSERNLYVLKNTNPAAVYVELANIKNHIDQKRITVPSNRQALADWLYEGLVQ